MDDRMQKFIIDTDEKLNNLEGAIKFLDEQLTQANELIDIKKDIRDDIRIIREQGEVFNKKQKLLSEKIKELQKVSSETLEMVIRRIHNLERALQGTVT